MNPAGGAELGYSARAGVARREARPVGTGKAVGSTPTIGSTSSFTSRMRHAGIRAGRHGLSAPQHGERQPPQRSLSPPRPWHFFVLIAGVTFRIKIAAWPPGPDVVGYRKRWSRTKVRAGSNPVLPRHAFRPGFARLHPSHASSSKDHRACDGPETVGYLLSRDQNCAPRSRFVRQRSRDRGGSGRRDSGYLDSAVAGSTPAARLRRA